MKLFSRIKPAVAAFAVAAVSLFASAAVVSAQVAPDVVFNNGTGVDIGDETNFLRIGDANGGNTTEACTDGQTVDLWFYVHNTNPTVLNGANLDGVGVARNTKVDIDFKTTGYASSQEIEAKVHADNSAISADNAFITCNGKQIVIEYVSQSMTTNAPASTSPYALTGSVMNDATLGYDGGRVPGCFEYRAYIQVKVKVLVKKVTPPPPPPVEKKPAVCKLIEATIINRVLTVKDVSYTANDDTIRAIRIEYGDGQTEEIATSSIESGKPLATYTYAKDGTYTVRATLLTAANKEITAAGCATTVKATTPVTPVKPTPVCVVPKVIALKDKARTIRVEATAQQLTGATVKRYVFSFGDGKTVTVDAGNASAATEHTYAQDGTYKVTVDVVYLIDGKEVTPQQTAGCAANVAIQSTPRPPVLPDTGVGSLVGIFVATSVAGAIAHRLVWARRFSR